MGTGGEKKRRGGTGKGRGGRKGKGKEKGRKGDRGVRDVPPVSTPGSASLYLTRIATHPHAHCHEFSLIGTPNCVSWRKPFVVLV